MSWYNPKRGMPVYGLQRRTFIGIFNDPPSGPHSIQIIVKNGNITLGGTEDTELDKNLAGAQVRSTPARSG